MPILNIQARDREVGRLRLGEKVATADGGTRPSSLVKFRLTSQDRQLLEQCAEVYGGIPEPWSDQWQLKIDADEIDILATFIDPTQWYEHWEKRGCIHRCDGCFDTKTESACSCDPDDRLCKPVTRITFFLPKLASLGVWRLETRSKNAAYELPNAVEYLQKARSLGIPVPATVALERRTSVHNGETRKFVVPVLRLRITLESLMGQIAERAQAAAIGESTEQSPAAELPKPASPTLKGTSAPALGTGKQKQDDLAARMRKLGWMAASAKEDFKRIKSVAAREGIDWQELAARAIENGNTKISDAADWVADLEFDHPEAVEAHEDSALPEPDAEAILENAFGEDE